MPGSPDPNATKLPPVRHVKIVGNRIARPDTDAIFMGNYRHIRVEGNEITGVIENGNHNDALQSVYGGDDLVFRGNYVHDNQGQGFFIKDGRATNVEVSNNLFVRTTGPLWQLQLYRTIGAVIKRNTAWNSEAPFILEGTDNRRVVVRNNVLNGMYVEDGQQSYYRNRAVLKQYPQHRHRRRLELGRDVTRQEGSASLPRLREATISASRRPRRAQDRLRGRGHLGGPKPRVRAPLVRERDVEDPLEAPFPVVLEDEGQPLVLGGRPERERLFDGRDERGAGRDEGNPVADAEDRGKVDRGDRPSRGQVFVELERAHGLRERSPNMGHEADVRSGDESRELWSGRPVGRRGRSGHRRASRAGRTRERGRPD